MDNGFTLKGNIVDIPNRMIRFGEVAVTNGKIGSVNFTGPERPDATFIMPGFVDSHIHIESSMLVPAEFARLAVVHGTVATVSDPHEIANVCGKAGVEFMLENAKGVPFHFYFGAPSCVPATVFETSGAALDAGEVDALLARDDIFYLSEMMNFPGVLNNDTDVMAKIASAKKYSKPVDGHAPGLRGEDAKQYAAAGISTDHECFTAEEAADKLALGMKILVREGSAAKNFDALIDLMHDHSGEMMFCSDDMHPDSLVAGHIDLLCARAVAKGIPVFKVLEAACINPVLHYNLTHGILREGDPADFIVVKDLKNFTTLACYIKGIQVAHAGVTGIPRQETLPINNFKCSPIMPGAFDFYTDKTIVPVIEAFDGQLITGKFSFNLAKTGKNFEGDVYNDILKIVVVNRYAPAAPAISFIKNFGLKRGAIASTVAHDSHNIVAIGTDDASLIKAVNLLIGSCGGISAVLENDERLLPLPVAGLMSNLDGYEIAEAYATLDRFVKDVLGSTLSAPFMTLSFMALLVIPHLKLSDRGLFDGDSFQFVR